MNSEPSYDLAILHIVDAGLVHGRRLRLTRAAHSGEIGTDVVFEWDDPRLVDDFIEQLREVSRDAWGEGTSGA